MNEYDPQSEMRAIHSRVREWFEAFVASPQHQVLTGIQRDQAPGVVRFFTEYSFRYVGAEPERWNRDVLDECCVEVLPRKMSFGQAFFQAVAPVLSAFFDFLAEKGMLSNARDLAKAVAELDGKIVAASQDERNRGPAKTLIMAADKAGVDTSDQQALSQFMIEYNLRQVARLEAAQAARAFPPPLPAALATPVLYPRPEPGRNQACPCGSGKKFKKCCGA